MEKKTLIFLVFFFAGWGMLTVRGQSADSLLFSKSVSNARSFYMKTVEEGSYLYSGVAYERYWDRMTGVPFFISEEFRTGSLYYNGALYEGVPLMYDILRDQLVTKNFSNDWNIRLPAEKIGGFSIGKNKFIRIVADSNHIPDITTGFYEELYDGRVSVLGRYEKRIEQVLRAEDKITKLVQHDRYFIEKDGKYYLITSESGLLSLFSDQRAELRKFLNRRGISFKKDPAAAIVQAVTYYEQLKK